MLLFLFCGFHMAKAWKPQKARHIDSGGICSKVNKATIDGIGLLSCKSLVGCQEPVKVPVLGTAGLDLHCRLQSHPDGLQDVVLDAIQVRVHAAHPGEVVAAPVSIKFIDGNKDACTFSIKGFELWK